MATLEEIYEKVVSDDGEKQTLAEAFATRESAAAFLAERDCDATPEELVALLKEKTGVGDEGETSDEALEGAAGGTGWDWAVSIGLVGIGCGFLAAISAITNRMVPEKKDVNKNPTFDLCND